MVPISFGREMGNELVVYGWDNLSTNDGPGVRFALYLKGCSLNCPWCLNPYLQKVEPEIRWKSETCVCDDLCIDSCKYGALQRENEHIVIDYNNCNFCGSCWNSCTTNSLKPVGEYISIDRIVSIVIQETVPQVPPRKVTIGGGEPLLQGEATINLIHRFKEEGIEVYLTTCAGITDRDVWARAIDLVDGVLLHILTVDESEWRELGGMSYESFLRNVYHLKVSSKPVCIRMPVIPGYTDSIQKVRSLLGFVKENIPLVLEMDLRVYTPNSRFSSPMFKLKEKTLTTEQILELCEAIKKLGIEKVHWRGSARKITEYHKMNGKD